MQYQRESRQRLQHLARYFPAVVLTGARQTGKTTLLKACFPDHNYVSLDLPSYAALAQEDPQSFLAQHKQPLLIDEVQYAPGLFRHLKIQIDQNRDSPGQYILTGSQKFTLMKAVSESLAGRAGVMELEGLSSEELGAELDRYLAAHGPHRVLARGFFPELWKTPSFPSFEFYQSYLATYLERDVRQLLNVTSLRDFERFMRACAIRSGNILNKSELAKDVGIHHKTANDWISVLEASNQIVLLEPYFANETKRIVKSPKLYFTDSGLLCALLGLREESIENYANIGAIWETFLFSRFRKFSENFGKKYSIWFYRDQRGLEVNFLLEASGKVLLVESKWSQLPGKSAIQSLEKLKRKIPTVYASYIACRAESAFPIGENLAVNGLVANGLASILEHV